MASGQEPEAQPDGEGDAGVVVDVQEGHVTELLASDETKLEKNNSQFNWHTVIGSIRLTLIEFGEVKLGCNLQYHRTRRICWGKTLGNSEASENKNLQKLT